MRCTNAPATHLPTGHRDRVLQIQSARAQPCISAWRRQTRLIMRNVHVTDASLKRARAQRRNTDDVIDGNSEHVKFFIHFMQILLKQFVGKWTVLLGDVLYRG
jgi:uncharacterized protein involved in type VI secretion and phage assembly